MDLRPISEKQKSQYNKLVTHVMQSWQWGEFRESLGTPLLRFGLFDNGKLKVAFQLTLHQIPLTKKYVGYLPKGPFPDKNLADALLKIAKENNCAFIKLEPNIEKHSVISSQLSDKQSFLSNKFKKAAKTLFTKHNFELDLNQSEDRILSQMHPKTRYNIKVAIKHGVKVEERLDDKAFEDYLNLYFDTTKRQNYHGHNRFYHKKVWEILKKNNMVRLLIAYYQLPDTSHPIPVTAWLLINFKDTLYYPYGGSSMQYRNVMANNLVAWEAIKLGQKLKLKKFDMWGALGENPDPKDPWIGFHNFKKGYGGRLVEFIGTYDLILDWPIYYLFNIVDKLTPVKVFLLRVLGK